MKHQGIRYSFTIPELIYFLFRKKVCPQCSGIMIKEKNYHTVTGASLIDETNLFFRPSAKVKEYTYSFSCSHCHARYTLSELASQNKKG